MTDKARILLVEDAPALARVYSAYVARAGHDCLLAETLAEARALIDTMTPDCVLLDIELPDGSGLDLLKELHASRPDLPVIMVTAHGSVGNAVEAMRIGAWDFIVKPFSADRLTVTLTNALANANARRDLQEKATTPVAEDAGRQGFHGFIGASEPMQAVYRMIDAVSPSLATVFITGESGTGKEVCAEAIHQHSPRCKKPFVALNCGAIPSDLVESEIFGHVKGAFTGAVSDRAGAAREADGGTLFLDELCELDIGLQAKLLRFLQTGMVQPVGANRTVEVDLRIICATNRDPMAEVKAGRLREDLYYRLMVVPLNLPRLAERGDDVMEIASAFLSRFAAEEGRSFTGFAPDARAALLRHDWPGNVRELQNVIRQTVVLHEGKQVTADMLPLGNPAMAARRRTDALDQQQAAQAAAAHISHPAASPHAPAASAHAGVIKPLWLVEREAIEAAIAAHDGNIPRAAAALEVSPSTIYRKKTAWDAADQARRSA